jgi:hypothetical protein
MGAADDKAKRLMVQLMNRGTRFRLKDTSGNWLDDLFTVDDIRQIDACSDGLVLLILHAHATDTSVIVDIASISEIHVSNPVQFDGQFTQTIMVSESRQQRSAWGQRQASLCRSRLVGYQRSQVAYR